MPDPRQGEPGRLAAATLAARRLEDVSDVLLLSAYGLALLALALGAGPAVVASGLGLEWRLLSAASGVLFAAVAFILLKYTSEATRALADLARSAARIEAHLEALREAPGAGRDAPREPASEPAPGVPRAG